MADIIYMVSTLKLIYETEPNRANDIAALAVRTNVVGDVQYIVIEN
jgi:hypothetical protein